MKSIYNHTVVNSLRLFFIIAIAWGMAVTSGLAGPEINPDPSPEFQSPQETIESFKLPDGYRAELVASEPLIREPAMAAWDANGRLYVAEMQTYVQNVDGDGTREPKSRIVRLTDTDGDGQMDESSVFVDNLVLPRLILPLDERILVGVTYQSKLWTYRDTTGDGRADEKALVYDGPGIDSGGNLEHQEGGLLWGLDNWIYTSMGGRRFRFTHGAMETEKIFSHFAQWGITQDDLGRMYFSSAGREVPAFCFQWPPAYGELNLSGQLAEGFQEPWPIIATPDVQGGPGRLRSDNTLNHFTGACGQSVFRGHRLPSDLYGDVFIPEPVGRLIRRAEVRTEGGKRVLHNAYDEKEFLASSDMNFRPVWTATGPDGCFYVVDMYRGIIQESNWVGKGSYLRKEVLKLGLQKNIGRGRIYRIVHESYEPGAKPNMLNETPEELVAHLSHPNGWWRQTAQKLLILRGDRSVVPKLKSLARNGESALGRMHALWTLEGMGVINRELLIEAYDDPDYRVRVAAIRISEALLKRGDDALLEKLAPMATDPSGEVALQLVLSLRYNDSDKAERLMRKALDNRPEHERMQHAVKRSSNYSPEATDKTLTSRGEEIYRSLCAHCHGENGRGKVTGGQQLAPKLDGSPRVNGEKSIPIKVLLHGLAGPVNGKKYAAGVMMPLRQNTDKWIADVLTYVRQAWGNDSSAVQPEEVAKVREATKGRDRYWTIEELE